jgi:2Fe-2S ferredoxin
MPHVHFISPLQDLTVDVAADTSLLDAAEEVRAQVGHSCGGVCACSTCHVFVRKGLASLS